MRPHPLARAKSRKSEFRMLRAAAQTTRREEGHPSRPNSRNVATTDASGATSNGNIARNAISTNSKGKAMDRSVLIALRDRKSTRLNSSHLVISYAVFCLKKKKNTQSDTDVTDDAKQMPPSN